jgi:3-oxocholest-4-en-26-oate---CoA ligase
LSEQSFHGEVREAVRLGESGELRMSFALGELNERIAEVIPEHEAIVFGERRLSWGDLRSRTRRLANLLLAAGLGCHRERDDLAPWESGQDHLALYLYNGNEYIEGMLGAYKARVAPFNVNYRYVEEELLYLFRDAATRGVIYHASFAPTLAKILPELPPMALLLQVDDGSGEPLLPGARDYEEALALASDAAPAVEAREDDLYIVYTGGTTGMPKGVLWKQRDIFYAAMGGRVPGGLPVASVDDILQRVPYGEMLRILPAPPFMHGASQWSSFIILHQGGTVVIPDQPRRLDPDDIWSTVERERVLTLAIVGDAFARPLLDQLQKKKYDLSNLQILGSGGAILSPALKKGLLAALPHVMIVDGFGSSETGAQGSTMTTAGSEVAPSFRMDEHTLVLDAGLARALQPGETEVGWLARTGHLPLGYLNDEAKTRRTYPEIGGVRYAVPGDRAVLAGDGAITVLGRDSVCINSGGEKVFAEEVEQALKQHPAVYDVVVTGTPNQRWGEQVTALVCLRAGEEPGEEELREAAARHLARYKLPKAFLFVDRIVRSASGKPDYRWAKQTATSMLAR